MTNYLPDLSQGTGPIYLRLANCMEADMQTDVLAPGTKLPPQRDLAYDIGVTIGTVGRAYSVLRERGLVSGEVGRGTYVLDRDAGPGPSRGPDAAISTSPGRYGGVAAGKLQLDSTPAPDVGQAPVIAEAISEITSSSPPEFLLYARNYPEIWMEAGSQWLAHGDFRPDHENIVPAIGAQAAVMAAISAVTSPGDQIAFEHLTYSQVSRSCALIGRRILQMRSDDQGLIPEEFERVCAQRHPKLAFLMPAAHNPTATAIPETRLREIAEIARKFNVWLVEDNLYGAMVNQPTPLLAELAPERTFLVGGFSKSVAAGLRGGWVACPENYAQQVRTAHRMITGGIPFLLAELNARLVLSQQAASIRQMCIAEINARLEIARTALRGYKFSMLANVPFIWLALPEPWLSSTFKNAAFGENVLIDDEDEYKAGRSDHAFHRVRIGVSAVRNRADFADGMATIRRLLEGGQAGYDSYG